MKLLHEYNLLNLPITYIQILELTKVQISILFSNLV